MVWSRAYKETRGIFLRLHSLIIQKVWGKVELFGMAVLPPREGWVLNFGFGRDEPLGNWKYEPYIPIFQEKVIHSYTNLLDFGPNYDHNYPIFLKFT